MNKHKYTLWAGGKKICTFEPLTIGKYSLLCKQELEEVLNQLIEAENYEECEYVQKLINEQTD